MSSWKFGIIDQVPNGSIRTWYNKSNIFLSFNFAISPENSFLIEKSIDFKEVYLFSSILDKAKTIWVLTFNGSDKF